MPRSPRWLPWPRWLAWTPCLLALALGGCLEDVEDERPDRRSPLPDGGRFDPGPRPQPGSGYGSGGSGSGSGGAGSGGSGASKRARPVEDLGVDGETQS